MLQDAKNEYVSYKNFDPSKLTRINLIKKLLLNIIHMVSIMESKTIEYKQLMVPISKILLLTSVGASADIKSKVVRITGYMYSMRSKLKNRFKL